MRWLAMHFSYKKLWKLLIDNNMLKKDLASAAKINANTMANMSKGKAVSLETLGNICRVLNCSIGDIVDIVFEESEGDNIE